MALAAWAEASSGLLAGSSLKAGGGGGGWKRAWAAGGMGLKMDGCDGLRSGGDEADDDFEVEDARRAEGGASTLGDRSELMSMAVGRAEWHANGRDSLTGEAMSGRS
jgi:hypothetical protein